VAHISYPQVSEVQLRLGPHEDAILAVVRGWSGWTHAEVEGRLPGDSVVSGVILTARRGVDTTIRELLQRGFRLEFPLEGGEGVLKAPEVGQAEPKAAGAGARARRRG
jgi:hypothetical protein